MKREIVGCLMAGLFIISNLTGGVKNTSEPDDYVTNDGYESLSAGTDKSETDTSDSMNRIRYLPKERIVSTYFVYI